MKNIRFTLRVLRNSVAILLLWIFEMIRQRRIITPAEMWEGITTVNRMMEAKREEVKN